MSMMLNIDFISCQKSIQAMLEFDYYNTIMLKLDCQLTIMLKLDSNNIVLKWTLTI